MKLIKNKKILYFIKNTFKTQKQTDFSSSTHRKSPNQIIWYSKTQQLNYWAIGENM